MKFGYYDDPKPWKNKHVYNVFMFLRFLVNCSIYTFFLIAIAMIGITFAGIMVFLIRGY